MQRLQQSIRLVRSRDGRDGAPPAPPPTQRKSARRAVPSPESRPESRASAESPVDEAWDGDGSGLVMKGVGEHWSFVSFAWEIDD